MSPLTLSENHRFPYDFRRNRSWLIRLKPRTIRSKISRQPLNFFMKVTGNFYSYQSRKEKSQLHIFVSYIFWPPSVTGRVLWVRVPSICPSDSFLLICSLVFSEIWCFGTHIWISMTEPDFFSKGLKRLKIVKNGS